MGGSGAVGDNAVTGAGIWTLEATGGIIRLALRKSTGTPIVNSLHPYVPPTYRKRSCSEFRPCQFATANLQRFIALDRSYSVFADGTSSRAGSRLPILLWKKFEPRGGLNAHSRGSGMATTSCCGQFWFEENRRQFPGRTADSDRRAALANGYCGALPVPCPLFPVPCPLWVPPPPLASLFGFRSRTSTCGLSFFCSLILPFLVC